jgi:hypothetical protein
MYNAGGRKPMDSATENNRLGCKFKVRVKTCGKSARLCKAIRIRGKPYREQDKIGTEELFVLAINVRVCRIDK